MKGLYIALLFLIGISVIASMTNEQMFQAPINHKKFKQFFSKQLASKDIYVNNIFTEIEKQVKAGATVTGVRDGIANLKDQLAVDQTNDDTVYSTKRTQLEKDITEQELELERLERQQNYLEAKLQVVTDEETNINGLWNEDHEAYEKRYAEQIAMKNVLEIIIDKVTGILLHDDTSKPKNVHDLFIQLKKVGKGNHVEALVELTQILTTGDIHDLLDKFVAFHQIVEDTIALDQEKEKENRGLFDSLSTQISEIKPVANEKLEQTNQDITDGEERLEQLEEELDDLIFKYEQRKELRANASTSAAAAQDQLESNLGRLINWEETVDQSTDKQEANPDDAVDGADDTDDAS